MIKLLLLLISPTIASTYHDISIAAANAASFLNTAHVSFSNQDLSCVQIPGANLSQSVCYSTNFWQADLRGVNFTRANLINANLRHTLMEDITFGEYAYLAFPKNVINCCYSTNGQWFAVANSNDVIVHNGKTLKTAMTLTGHTEYVRSIAFSPDGNKIASGSADHTIRLWDHMSGLTMHTLTGHNDLVMSVVFNPNGKQIVSGSFDKTIRIWDCLTGLAHQVLIAHTGIVSSVVFSPDGKYLASGSFDNTIRLWDPIQGQTIQILMGHSENVNSIAFSPDSLSIISGSDDQTCRLWDLKSEQTTQILSGHGSDINSVIFSPDGTQMASASSDGTVRLWDRLSGQTDQILKGHKAEVHTVVFSPDGKQIVSGGAEGKIRFWDRAKKQFDQKWMNHSSAVNAVAFSPDEQKIASASWGTICIWHPLRQFLQVLKGGTRFAQSLVFSLDGTKIATSGSCDNKICVWDLTTGQIKQTLLGHNGCRADDVVGGLDIGVQVEFGTWENIILMSDSLKGVYSVAFSPDSKKLVSGGDDQTVRIWDLMNGINLHTLTAHTDRVRKVVFSADGIKIASGSNDQTVLIWNAVDGQMEQTLTGHTGPVTSVVFSTDGTEIVSGSWDETIRIWNLASGKTTKILKGHTNKVTSLVLSPDNTTIASGSTDKSIRLWEKNKGKVLSIMKTGAPVGDIAWAKKTPHIISGHSDYSIKYWQIIEDEKHITLRLLNNWPQQLLMLKDVNVKGAIGLSENNIHLLKQRGAIDVDDEATEHI